MRGMEMIMWSQGLGKTAPDGTNTHTNKRTWRLYDWIGPVGPIQWKFNTPFTHVSRHPGAKSLLQKFKIGHNWLSKCGLRLLKKWLYLASDYFEKIELKSTKNSQLSTFFGGFWGPNRSSFPIFETTFQQSVFFNLSLLFWQQDRQQSVSTCKFGSKISNIFYVQKWGIKTVRK